MELGLLEKICRRYALGKLERPPFELKGGYMHKVYALFTQTGRYAVKLLNPCIMCRETAAGNFHTAEKLELLLERESLPIIPALVFENQKMQSIDNHYFYIYEWYDGTVLRSEEVTEAHCRKIAEALAKIHALDRCDASCNCDEIHIDWDFYIDRLFSANRELYDLLTPNLSLLYESQNNRNAAIKKLPPVVAICHNDMDTKNVLWSGMDFRIIDLECLGYANPFSELFELALCWSGLERCQIDYRLFRAFLRAYADAGTELPTDWVTLYWSNYDRLKWLEFNLKRALGIECSKEDVALGISQVKYTLSQVIYYRDAQESILENCIMLN